MQETPKSLIWLRFTAEPRTGRFITRDSYRGERENVDTWHLYAYCANNPINYVDPSGHFIIALPAFGSITAGVLISAIQEAVLVSVGIYIKTQTYKVRRALTINPDDRTKIAGIISGLATSVKKSWKHKRDKVRPRHHVIPRTASKSANARSIWTKKHNMSINSSKNLVKIKANLHKHLHSDKYYYGVDALVRASQYLVSNLKREFPKLIPGSKVKSIQKTTCLGSVAILKKAIQAANVVSKG